MIKATWPIIRRFLMMQYIIIFEISLMRGSDQITYQICWVGVRIIYYHFANEQDTSLSQKLEFKFRIFLVFGSFPLFYRHLYFVEYI